MLSMMAPRTNSGLLFAETANRSTDGLNDDLMSPEGYVATAAVLFSIGFFGFFFNLVVILLVITDKELRSPMNIILFNLVCSDFSVSVLGNPFTLTASIFHHWIFGRTMCVMYGFFMSLLGINSIATLTFLSFERYVMISRPFHRHQLTSKGAKIAVAGIWLYAFILTGPPLFGWGDYVNESANISCSVNWEHNNFSATTYIIFLFAFGLVIPVVIIVFSYVNIIITLRQNTLRMSRVSRAEAKVALMVAVMIIAFLTAWTPYAVLALIIAFGDADVVTPGIAVIPALMAKSSICYNPIIYAGLNPQFQASWKKTVGSTIQSPRSADAGELTTITTPKTRYFSTNCMKKATKVTFNGRSSVVTKSKLNSPDQFGFESEACSEILHIAFPSADVTNC